jgi:hypothetical protein
LRFSDDDHYKYNYGTTISETNQEMMQPKMLQDNATLDTADTGMEEGMTTCKNKYVVDGVTTNPAHNHNKVGNICNKKWIGTLPAIAILVTVGLIIVGKVVVMGNSSSQDTASALVGWVSVNEVGDKAETIVVPGNNDIVNACRVRFWDLS